MTIPFDHTQFALDSNMILGAATTTILKTGTFTDEEFFRTWINPGLVGVFTFLEAELAFNSFNSNAAANHVYEWQIRPTGQAVWVSIFISASATWPTNIERKANLIFEPAGDLEDDVPFEMRLLITSDAAGTITVAIDNTDMSVRVVGDSI